MNNQDHSLKSAVKRALKEFDATDGTECPGEAALIQYGEGSLTEEQVAGLEDHLSRCDLCLDIVIEYRRLLEVEAEEAGIEVPEAVTRRSMALVPEKPPIVPSPIDVVLKISGGVVRILKRAADITPTMLEPVPIRGAEAAQELPGDQGAEMVSFSREFGKVIADVEVLSLSEGLFALNVTLSEMATGMRLEGVRVTLTDMEYELESARTRLGMVRFEDHEVGTYGLEMESGDSPEPARITLKIEND